MREKFYFSTDNLFKNYNMKNGKYYFILFLKGIGIGAANVIPGVSGGTIAFLTGILEDLMNSIKSFNQKAFRLLIDKNFKEFSEYVNLPFLLSVFAGVTFSIFSFAYILKYLFSHYQLYVWSFFFGLIFASIYFIGKSISKINLIITFSFLVGFVISLLITFANPLTENKNFFYLILCGILGVCSMILPGISGSYVLLIMGNYELIMLKAVSELNLNILIPVIIGAAIGLIAFSHFLSWLINKYRNQTIATLTGFIAGSLFTIWPWKIPIYKLNDWGSPLLNKAGEPIIISYKRYIPSTVNNEVLLCILFFVIGMLTLIIIELLAKKLSKN